MSFFPKDDEKLKETLKKSVKLQEINNLHLSQITGEEFNEEDLEERE